VNGGDCAGESATYQIGVDGPTEPALTLIADDISGYATITTTHSVTGTASVVLEPEEDVSSESIAVPDEG
jgi:hypothetical protein